jgi:hypothetical protein
VNVADIVSEVETAGVVFQLEGEKVHMEYPCDERREELAAQIALLRSRRDEVIAYLKARSAIPPMPDGVRVIRYEPQQGPILIESYAVVTEVRKFIEAELQELAARLHAPQQIRGGWGIFTILDRLAQCGVELEIIRPSAAPPPSNQ